MSDEILPLKVIIDNAKARHLSCEMNSDVKWLIELPMTDIEQQSFNIHIEAHAALQARLDAAHAREDEVVAALLTVLDQVDYQAKACRPTEMVGACLSTQVISNARAAIAKTRHDTAKEQRNKQ